MNDFLTTNISILINLQLFQVYNLHATFKKLGFNKNKLINKKHLKKLYFQNAIMYY